MFNLDPRRIDARKPLASGSFGTIHAYLNEKNNTENKEWVVKRIPAKTTKELKFFMQEAVLGFNHRHPFVVSNRGYDIRDSPQGGWDIFIKMPRMDKSLKNVIGDHNRAKTKPKIKDVIEYFYSVATGLDSLQGKRIIHNNVNPGTILIDNENTAKIGSVGLAQHKPWKEGQTGLGTHLYMAPERLDRYFAPEKDTAFKGDVWSLGVTIMELCLLGKVKRYYPETNDDWLDLDSEESKPKEEKKAPEKEKKVNENEFDFNKEEEKVNVERALKAGDVLVEESLQEIESEYGKKLGDVGENENPKKLLRILRKMFILNPKDRISFAEICKELKNEFPSEVKIKFL